MKIDRPVIVSAARYENRWARLTETNGADISADTILVAATPAARPHIPPTADQLTAPDDVRRPSADVVEAALFVDENYPGPAGWDLWIAVNDSPELPALYAGTFYTA